MSALQSESPAALASFSPFLPRHLGLMMDGNGRWAAARGLPRLAGHRAGTQNVRRVLKACRAHGLKVVSLYVFSTENWGRPREEVEGFFALLSEVIEAETEEFARRGVRLLHSGALDGLPAGLAAQVQRAVERTRHNRASTVNIAFNYGGRAEILRAAQALARTGLRPDEVTEARWNAELYTAGLPDIDLIVRAGGNERLSNFFPYQAAFAELYTTPVLWPDMDEAEITRALEFFRGRIAARGFAD